MFLVFLISVGLTIVYFFLLRLSRDFRWQIRMQFVLDSLLDHLAGLANGRSHFSIHYALYCSDQRCEFFPEAIIDFADGSFVRVAHLLQ